MRYAIYMVQTLISEKNKIFKNRKFKIENRKISKNQVFCLIRAYVCA